MEIILWVNCQVAARRPILWPCQISWQVVLYLPR